MIEIEQQLTKLISSIPNVRVKDVELEHPTNTDFGDYSCNAAMQIFSSLKDEQKAKLQLESPRDLAQMMVSQIENNLEKFPQIAANITKIEVAGPGFINFYLSDEFFITSLKEVIANQNFGQLDIGKGKAWELEHTSPNPNKSMHLGHLRNNLVGMALGRIWEKAGIKVIFEAVDNNRGIAIAKLMWGYLKFARKDSQTPIEIDYWVKHPKKWQTPEDLDERPDRFVDKLYVLGSVDFEKDDQVEQAVRQMVVDWEGKDEPTWKLWEQVLNYSYQGQQLTLQRIGNRWDKVWHEHEYYQLGKELIEKGIKSGVFQVLDDGAVLTKLEAYSLPDTIVRKADGTALYITQDIALTKLKIEELSADKLHWVVGPEQRLALMQVFAVCEQLKIARVSDLEHIPYGYMSIKGSGKMSSREGNVIYIDELLDEAKEKAHQLIKSDSITKEDKDQLAEEIGVGAVKYSILKVSRASDMAFDINAALSLEGNSGPYLQYTHARSKSVLRKAEVNMQKMHELLTDQNKDPIKYISVDEAYNSKEVQDLLKVLYRYPTVVEEAALNNEPSLVATYLYDLSQKFNSFYNKHQIIVDDRDNQIFRLSLTAATSRIIKSGLSLLGIEAPEKM